MDVANADIPSAGLNSFAQEPCVTQTVFHDFSETVESKVNKIVILRDNLGTRTGEI